MDKASLVEFGRAVIQAMDEDNVHPRAAMWVNNTDTDSWKLWIVPSKKLLDQREFYRKAAALIAPLRDRFPGFDIADIEIVEEKHPAIKGMSQMFRVSGVSSISLTGNSFNGVYMPDGILMRMEI